MATQAEQIASLSVANTELAEAIVDSRAALVRLRAAVLALGKQRDIGGWCWCISDAVHLRGPAPICVGVNNALTEVAKSLGEPGW